ncbi:MAG: PASTA domain-containing protein [Bacilli bacterium]|nr:PASTA domain-containing protein [Bacilli bacterium]
MANTSKKKNTAPKKKNSTTTNKKKDIIEDKKIDVKEVKKKKVVNEIKEEIDNSFVEREKEFDTKSDLKLDKPKKHIFVHFFLIILLLVSLFFFVINIMDHNISLYNLVNNLLLTIFTILFVGIGFTYNKRKKGIVFFGSLVLLAIFAFGINNKFSFVNSPIKTVEDFSGKDLAYVMKWASKNSILINQEYEYSDMVQEYGIISQDVLSGTDISNVKEITIAVSEGPNPYKEIIVPSMISWDSERVLKFVRENYLSNVIVEFIASDKAKDTVIEQSASGNLSRDDELKLTFSYGEELGYEEVKLIDFTNKSKFEVEFYMKQHQLNYEFNDDFDSKIKRGFAVRQDIAAGEMVKVNSDIVKVTISKGPKIKVPELKDYSLTELTEWAIKNKLKLSFIDKYDDTVKENGIVKASHNKGDIVEQGTVIEITLSRGSLKMPKFKALDDFYTWADKYEIKYEEEHEFSDSVPAGSVISFSYKTGQTLKNDDVIIVKISDGKKKEVPNLKGLTKKEAISKLEKAGLKYSFVYKNSDQPKDKVLSQSISAGSEISASVTITVTLSNGKKEEETPDYRKENSHSESNNNNNENNSGSNPTPTPDPEPEPSCDNVTVYIDGSHISNEPSVTCSKIKSAYSSLRFSCSYVCGPTNGLLLNSGAIDEHTFSTCDTINLRIADNSKC